MTAMSDRLEQIEARAKEPTYTWAHELREDRDYLLALVREQQARLVAVSSILDEWASHKAFPDAEESQQWYSLGKRHAADAIRAALTASHPETES